MKKILLPILFISTVLLGGCGINKDTIKVLKVENITNDFILGMDVSSLISLEESGIKYYDFDNKETDLLKILKDNGINYIRTRIWNDPYDKDGNGYGGGNSDISKAIQIGKRATQYGLKLLVDFHYSDFWTDPGKYIAPKAWKNLSINEKENALYEFSKDSLNKLKENNINVGMVQVGNEINSGLSDELYGSSNYYRLLKKGSQAVREIYPNALIAMHYADPQKNYGKEIAKGLKDNNIDYDVFGYSYYPMYHGTLDNLGNELESIASTYNKKVMVLETSYPYTDKDFDGKGNTYPSTNYPSPMYGYEFSTQGQANLVRDVVDTVVNKVSNNKGIGVCYWEGAWLGVASSWEEAFPICQKYGSGWASHYAYEYQPNDIDKDYESGCVIENQAFFDENGKALDSLKVFKYLKSGN